ncbi:alpha/beta fold hydrolase [Leucobacter sp. GX24907]
MGETPSTGRGNGPDEFSLRDAHGIDHAVYRWDAEDPIGVVQIMHGVGEHAKRYRAFAETLVAAGFTVYADDHRGHGETWRRQWRGDRTKLGKLGPGGLRATEAALLQLTALIRDRHPGLPVIAFAHSWGSLMAQRVLGDHPRAFDAVVLSGSAHRTPRGLESGDLNARWRGADANGFEWLSRDPAVSRAFIADELCFGTDILKLFGLPDALRLYGTPRPGLDPDLPLLIISGGDDPLHRGERHLRRLAKAYRKRGLRDVTVKVYPEARHEILNETNRDEVQRDIITWMLERVGPSGLLTDGIGIIDQGPR